LELGQAVLPAGDERDDCAVVDWNAEDDVEGVEEGEGS